MAAYTDCAPSTGHRACSSEVSSNHHWRPACLCLQSPLATSLLMFTFSHHWRPAYLCLQSVAIGDQPTYVYSHHWRPAYLCLQSVTTGDQPAYVYSQSPLATSLPMFTVSRQKNGDFSNDPRNGRLVYDMSTILPMFVVS